MAKSKYLISGIGPGRGGVGALMQNLTLIAERNGFHVIANWNGPSLRRLLERRHFLQLVKILTVRLLKRIRFSLASRFVKNSKVIFLHPQTAGFKTLFRLAEKNELFFYVMDNSFFCIRSYNCHPSTKQECFLCLGNVENVSSECAPFPIPMGKKENLNFLKNLQLLAPRITFLCQNDNQSKLLKMHFGPTTKCKLIGMDTGELYTWSPKRIPVEKCIDDNPYILFHGTAIEPKGLDYVLRLAERMQAVRFIIPAPAQDLHSRFIPQNVECQDVTWLNGLKELVENASLVLNPSMWSAPIEGALIKSLAHNPNVATVETRYGYESEIPDEVGLIRLPQDIILASKIIEQFLDKDGGPMLIDTARIKWLKELNTSNQFERFISSL